MLTIKEAADRVGVTVRTLKNWESSGRIPTARRQRRGQLSVRVYTEEEVRAIERSARPAAPEQLPLPPSELPHFTLLFSSPLFAPWFVGSAAAMSITVEIDDMPSAEVGLGFDTRFLRLAEGESKISLPPGKHRMLFTWSLEPVRAGETLIAVSALSADVEVQRIEVPISIREPALS
jgi:hypothetical protein